MPKVGGKLSCSCGYRTRKKAKVSVIKEVVKEKEQLEIIEEDSNTKALPITAADCPECNHEKAHYWLLQTRSSDEPETKFFQCAKCKHRWRDYD